MELLLKNRRVISGREAIIEELISRKLVKKYGKMSIKFKKETSHEELPALYKTKHGYLYAVIA